jgi:hypothetical protein
MMICGPLNISIGVIIDSVVAVAVAMAIAVAVGKSVGLVVAFGDGVLAGLLGVEGEDLSTSSTVSASGGIVTLRLSIQAPMETRTIMAQYARKYIM